MKIKNKMIYLINLKKQVNLDISKYIKLSNYYQKI